MCGICGIYSPSLGAGPQGFQAAVSAMTDTLIHRGPDDGQVWTDAQAGIAMGFRRLSIIDLSAAGRQPMASASQRYMVAYNGEIYNFQELRSELEARGHIFRGHSDTEVLLAAITEWGVRGAVQRANGMFAFALWDRQSRTLTLGRDRLGKKPLYYGWCGKSFLFGSELKSLQAHPDFDDEIDRDALGLLVQHQWIPAPYSIYRCIRKLPAGTLLTLRSDETAEEPSPEPYWLAKEAAERGERAPFAGSPTEAADELERLLRDAVKKRMMADVELGALLSGGIDSTTVVALMQAQSDRPVKTFTIGFPEAKYNEAEHAKAISEFLGTDHTELYVTPEDGLALIPRLATLYDEPFADPSQMPTFLVSHLARSKVTVALSGDGGDEVFGGYPRYFQTPAHWDRLRRYPLVLRRALQAAAQLVERRSWEAFVAGKRGAESRPGRLWRYPAKLRRRTARLAAESALDLFTRSRVSCERGAEFVIGCGPSRTVLNDPASWPDVDEPRKTMIYLDTVSYLPDDILVKVDRASMGVSLELRSPLLDYRVVEFAWTLPLSVRIGQEKGGKEVLRKVLDRYVSRDLTDRPKKGFSVPISSWLRGPMRDWAEDLLNEERLRSGGFFHIETVRRAWQQHLAGWCDNRDLLWSVLMFQSWHDASSRQTSCQTPLKATA